MAWQIPNGTPPPKHRRGIAAAGLTNIFPPTGSPSQAGLLVSRGTSCSLAKVRTDDISMPTTRRPVSNSGKPNCPRARRRRCR